MCAPGFGRQVQAQKHFVLGAGAEKLARNWAAAVAPYRDRPLEPLQPCLELRLLPLRSVARQKEVARRALDDILDPVWGDILAECDLLLPRKMAKADGIKALSAVTFDLSQLGGNERLLFQKTVDKVSAAADALAVRRQAPRAVCADGTSAFAGEVCEAAEALARVCDRADSEGITAGIAVIGSQGRIDLEEEGRACGRIKSKDTTPKFDPVLTRSLKVSFWRSTSLPTATWPCPKSIFALVLSSRRSSTLV
jgi:hypothetical protein